MRRQTAWEEDCVRRQTAREADCVGSRRRGKETACKRELHEEGDCVSEEIG